MQKAEAKLFVANRAARYHYEILASYEAGVVLTGREVKACRTARPLLRGAYVTLDRAGEAWLRGMEIPEYSHAKGQPHDRTRDKKLLLSRKELAAMAKQLAEQGIAAPVLNLHERHGKLKVEIGIGRGKKKWDKRETLKKRDLEREARRGGR